MRNTLERVRQVMAERHIGIVLVGSVAFMAVSQSISLLNEPLGNVFITFYNQHRNVADTFAANTHAMLPGTLIFTILFGTFVMFYLAVYLYWWIYNTDESPAEDAAQSGENL